MAKKAGPEWLVEGVGFVDVTLSREAIINGVKQKAMRMREPTVADSEVVSDMDGTDALRELTAIANLCDTAPADLRQLPLRDFKRLQVAYLSFLD